MSLVSDMEAEFTGQLANLYKLALSSSTSTVAMGDGLMGYFLGILIVWKGIEFALVDRDKGEVMFEFIKIIILWGMVKWILTSYPWWIESLYSGFKVIQSTIAVNFGQVSSYTNSSEGLLAKIAKIIAMLTHMDGVGLAKIELGFSYALAIVNLMLASFILSLLTIIFQSVAMIMIAIANIYIIIGVLMGPVMIPFLLFPYLSWIADGWIRYMITAGMIFVVINLILAMASKLGSEYVAKQTQKIEAAIAAHGNIGAADVTSATAFLMSQAVNFTSILYLAAMYAIMALVILQAPSIAEMLLAGTRVGAGVGGASASGIKIIGNLIGGKK